MKITVIHPTRQRPDMAIATARKWLSSAKNNIEYIFSMDSDDPTYERVYAEFKETPNVLFNLRYHTSAIHAINAAAEIAIGDLFVVVSDDFECPYHWDEFLLQQLEGKSDFVVKTDDGAQPWIITLPILDRAFYNRFGYIYNPGYIHMYSDTEMTHVGHLLGRVITLPIKFKHNHPDILKRGRDAINIKNDASYPQGEKLYIERFLRNFDLPNEQIISNPYIHPSHLAWMKSKGLRYV